MTPPTSEVTVNSAPVTPLEGWLNLTERPGTYWVNASAPGFVPQSVDASVTAGASTLVTLLLQAVGPGGYLDGSVTPATAAVLIDGAPVAVGPSGAFNQTVAAGDHSVSASSYGYFPQVDASVAVYSGLTTRVVLRLLPEFATLEGTVDPPSATVAIAGALTSLTPGGFFSTQRLAGTYWVNASAFERGGANRSVQLTPGNVTNLSIVLPFSVGWVEATVAPVTAEVTLGGRPLALGVDGQFNASMAPGSYWLNATAPGHRGLGQRVIVAAGRTTIETVDLPAVAAAPWWRSQASFDAAAGTGALVTGAALLGWVAVRRRRVSP